MPWSYCGSNRLDLQALIMANHGVSIYTANKKAAH